MPVMPDRPATTLCHASSTVLPTGLTMPSPVTTTRRWDKLRLLREVALDVVDGLLHGGDLLGVFVRDLGLELLLERHHELDRVERIGAEVVDERRFVLDLRLVHPELLGDDLLDARFHVVHADSF